MATKATVHYELTADESKAVDAFRKLSREQQKTALSFQKTAKASEQMGDKATRAARRSQSSMAKLGAGVRSVTSMLGVGLGGFSFASAVAGIARGMDVANAKVIAFEREMTELLSLGENTSNIEMLRTQVLDLSTAYRESTKSITDFLFTVQSSSAGLDASVIREIRDESIELSEVTGTDLKTSLTAVMKAYQIYGDEVANVDALQNKLFIAAERGWMSFAELGTLFPDVAATTKTFGYSLNEVLGALSIATRLGGRNEKTFTGLRNVMSRMNQAAEAGIPLTGDLVTDLRALGDVDPDSLKQIFGEEAISVVAVLRDNVAALVEDIKQIASIEGDLVKQRKELRESDPQYAFARRMEQTQMSSENATVRGGGSEGTRDFSLYYEEAKRGWREITPAFLHGLPLVEWGEAVVAASMSALTGSAKGLAARGQEAIVSELVRVNPSDAQKYVGERNVYPSSIRVGDIGPSGSSFMMAGVPVGGSLGMASQPSMPAANSMQQSADNLAVATVSLVDVVKEVARQQREQSSGRMTGHQERVQRITNLNAGV